ncbi:E7 early protein [Bos taurus papillomavirus 40]|nr:E7 early protein [Bos taurus papillomavirus 40]
MKPLVGGVSTLQDEQQLVCPVNLECEEEVIDEVLQLEAEWHDPFVVATDCNKCGLPLFFCVYTTHETIRSFHHLLAGNLNLLCSPCSQTLLRNNGF